MPEQAYVIETRWLQEVLEGGFCDVFFSSEAEATMGAAGITRPEVVSFMKRNPVSHSVRCEGGAGWCWVIEGTDCDERAMRVVLEVETNVVSIEVIEVQRE